MNPQELSQIQNGIAQLASQEQDLNREKHALNSRAKILSAQPAFAQKPDLRKTLSDILPAHMMPGNVGGYNTVMWPYRINFDFDFGTNPTITNLTRLQAREQVSQDAAFIVLSVSRTYNEANTAGNLGPFTLVVRDNQSSRQLMNNPMPMQMIGSKSEPSVFPTGYLFMPTAQIEMEMGTWLTAGQSQALVGDAKFQFSLFGYRIRVEDFEKVVSTVFSGGM